MGGFRGEVDGAAEDVQDAAVYMVAHLFAEGGVKRFGVASSQIGHLLDAQEAQVFSDGGPDSGDAPEIVYLSDHTASSFPLGSVKWKRRPPGKGKISLTMAPPAAWTWAWAAARSAA